MGFAGFDRSEYPGAAVMKWLRANTNLVWCGYYLAPAPSHQDPSWMNADEADLAGWGFAPIYVGQQTTGPGSHLVTAEQGAIDGKQTCDLMTQTGFEPGAKVWLDQEQGGPEPAAMRAYTNAWAAAVAAARVQALRLHLVSRGRDSSGRPAGNVSVGLPCSDDRAARGSWDGVSDPRPNGQRLHKGRDLATRRRSDH